MRALPPVRIGHWPEYPDEHIQDRAGWDVLQSRAAEQFPPA
jgi:hypothetical protein